jgi:hypothetical protein
MREQPPAASRKWRLADYAKWDSAVVSIFGDGQSNVEAQLAKAGVVRRIGLSRPHFTARTYRLVVNCCGRLSDRLAKIY